MEYMETLDFEESRATAQLLDDQRFAEALARRALVDGAADRPTYDDPFGTMDEPTEEAVEQSLELPPAL
jgi:hypothetical protein